MPKEMPIKEKVLCPEILGAYQGAYPSVAKVPGRAWERHPAHNRRQTTALTEFYNILLANKPQ